MIFLTSLQRLEMGNVTSTSGTGDERSLLALAGRVPVKVIAEAGAIRIGDLLTSSSKTGDALQPLASGNGTIQALLTLQ